MHQLIIKKIQRPRPTLLRFSTVVTWLYFLQSIFETKNYSREKICGSCRLSLPNYVLYTHRLDQVYRSPVPECRLEEVTPYLPSKEPVLHYAGSKDHLTHLLSGLRVEHIPNSISLYVRSLVPYTSDIIIMSWTLNVWKRGRGIMLSLYLHLPYIGCTHVPGPPSPSKLLVPVR